MQVRTLAVGDRKVNKARSSKELCRHHLAGYTPGSALLSRCQELDGFRTNQDLDLFALPGGPRRQIPKRRGNLPLFPPPPYSIYVAEEGRNKGVCGSVIELLGAPYLLDPSPVHQR